MYQKAIPHSTEFCRGLQEEQNTLMETIVRTILSALQERAIQEYISRHPDRYCRHGYQPQPRKFITSFGPIHFRLAHLFDRQTEKVFSPLVERLSILPYKQYQREALEAAVGQAIHLSYRMAEKEVKRQVSRGAPLDKAEMRWALASVGVRKRFDPVGFWVDKDWKFIRHDLEKRLDYGKLEVLFSLTQELLEEVLPPERELVVKLAEKIKQGFDNLTKAFDPHRYPKARTYIENFASSTLLAIDY